MGTVTAFQSSSTSNWFDIKAGAAINPDLVPKFHFCCRVLVDESKIVENDS